MQLEECKQGLPNVIVLLFHVMCDGNGKRREDRCFSPLYFLVDRNTPSPCAKGPSIFSIGHK